MEYRKILRTILVFIILPGISVAASRNCNKEKRCKMSKVQHLVTADCYRYDLKQFPKCIPSNVEVIELSYNRIRKVSKSDLSYYPYVKHLYLMDNLIVSLDEDAFDDLKDLETLGLSMNAINKIPHTIFELPNLKTLYLSQNLNINIIDAIEKAKPISSPLTKLDISFLSEEDDYISFPDFGEMPLLAMLNVSGNNYMSLSRKHFVGLCNLQILTNVNATAYFDNECDCWNINNWLKDKKVRFTPFTCTVKQAECLTEDLSPEESSLYETCSEKLRAIELKALLIKIGIGLGVVLGVIIIGVAYYFYRRKKNTETKNNNLKMKNTNVTQEDMKPLNNQSKV